MRISLLAAFLLTAALLAGPARAADEAPSLTVERARLTLLDLTSDPDTVGPVADYLKKAKGVLIIPQLVKAGFIVGGEYGKGVLVARTAPGDWSDPSFYSLAAGSIGLQIGVEAKQILLVVMTEKGLNSLMSDQLKFGADASVAVGTLGGGVGASSAGSLGADFIAFAKSKGLFGGGALDGAVIQTLPEQNEAFYRTAATPKQILIERTVSSGEASQLRNALSKY
ncbi:lipid-binding SYLF domain-containing protein [Nisaea acidiphila]|uniref:Lipid-binding SYLF domain-containing protein n=1 Tax=Nisaea acidiphila TaxID=1862145 RepID=A0A9J7B075_9PROT|nr:lipid-binding SYLF domain-containing protein [Nisaea acidiphila]UUX52065.1 lipid-binding SYLF domain-containing protein [Nisaea acidiphila]